jgi:kynureninase
VADFRAPHYLRVGFTPLYLSTSEVAEAVDKLAEIMQQKIYLNEQFQRRRGAVT